MKHNRPDYEGRIIDTAGKIPEDEPVFLLRGQDQSAPSAIRAWATRHEQAGGHNALSSAARQFADQMDRYQEEHGSKLADWPDNPDDTAGDSSAAVSGETSSTDDPTTGGER